MTTSPESRAQQLADAMLDRGYVPIISTECRALIAAAIREAVAAEREACALRAERDDRPKDYVINGYTPHYLMNAREIAADIRARKD